MLSRRDSLTEVAETTAPGTFTFAELSGVDYKHTQLLESKNPPCPKLDTIEKLAKREYRSINNMCEVLLEIGLKELKKKGRA